MLGRGELRCIGATTLNEFRKYIEKDPALERRFQQVMVNEPSVADTISILRGLRERRAPSPGATLRSCVARWPLFRIPAHPPPQTKQHAGYV